MGVLGMKDITKRELLKLVDYLQEIAEGYTDDETFDMDTAEIENEILYSSSHEI